MPATDSKQSAILAWIASQLTNLGGVADVWYPPVRVVTVDEPVLDHFVKHRDVAVLYLVSTGFDLRDENRTTGEVFKALDVDVVCARRTTVDRTDDEGGTPFDPFRTPSDTPPSEAPEPHLVRERMAQDVERALRADPVFGGLGYVIQLWFAHRNFHYYVDGWDAVHLPMTVQYKHRGITP